MAMEVGVLPVSGSVAFTDIIQNDYNEIIIFGSQKITFKRRISCKGDIDILELQDAAKLITFVFFLVGEFS